MFFCACDGDRLPAIKRLLQILATLSVATATSEWSFSTLRRFKTYLQNTTTGDRLNEVAMLNVHRNIEVEPDQVMLSMSYALNYAVCRFSSSVVDNRQCIK